MMAARKMTLLIAVWFAVLTVSISQGVPKDCVVLGDGSHCYTFSNNVKASFPDAQKACESSKGQLPIIADATTWNLLKQQFLVNFAFTGEEHVWMGVSVDANGQTVPLVDVNFETWAEGKTAATYPDHCLVSYSPSWWINGFPCTEMAYYFCQYKEEVMSCNTKYIEDSNAVIENSCSTTNVIPSNTSVQISCLQGYYLNTKSPITCRWGHWDEVQCIPGCPAPGKRNNAQLTTLKSNYEVGDKIVYICDNSYYSWNDHRMTHFILTCQNDSTWSDKGVEGCGNKNEFSIRTIDVASISTSVIELECSTQGVGTYWFRNGKNITTEEFNAERYELNVKTGNLIVQVKDDADVDGLYTCAELTTGLEVGRKAYQIVRSTKCQSQNKREVQTGEGNSLLLPCPQEHKDYSVKWFKDEEEIFSSKYRNVIQSTGLYFPNITFLDGGSYKCETTSFEENDTGCMQNVSYDVSVTALVENICGISTSNSHSQPWLVALYKSDEKGPFCYGTLINSKWVLTSAFCLSSLQRKLSIENAYVVPVFDIDKRQVLQVASVKIHPRYRRRLIPNDIGLVELRGSPIQFNSTILPACLSPDDVGNIHKCEDFGGLSGIVARKDFVVHLQSEGSITVEAKPLLIEHMSLDAKAKCQQPKSIGFSEDKFCAKFNGSEENFAGDNGSPFIVNYKGRSYLLGVFTWGERVTGSGMYDYYTSIYSHYDWIKSVIS